MIFIFPGDLSKSEAINIKRILFDVDFTLMLDWQDPSVVGLTAKEIEALSSAMNIFNPEVVIVGCSEYMKDCETSVMN